MNNVEFADYIVNKKWITLSDKLLTKGAKRDAQEHIGLVENECIEKGLDINKEMAMGFYMGATQSMQMIENGDLTNPKLAIFRWINHLSIEKYGKTNIKREILTVLNNQ